MKSMMFVKLAVLLAGLVAACGGAERDESGEIVSEGSVDVYSVRVGDCFQDPEGILQVESLEVADIEAVPCSSPHDNEAYHLFNIASGPWPGETAIFNEADQECFGKFEPFVGQEYTSSRLEFSYLYPTEQSWGDGDREIVCFLFDVNLERLSGSMRGSGE
jgi:hypothetical protein